jgi:hypothetical protein
MLNITLKTTDYQGVEEIPVRASNGRVIGSIKGDTLTKKVKKSKHLLRKPRGWAWDCEIIRKARAIGATKVEIIDTENGVEYHAPVSAYLQHGVEIDYGFGRQIVLPISRFHVQRAGQMKLPL